MMLHHACRRSIRLAVILAAVALVTAGAPRARAAPVIVTLTGNFIDVSFGADTVIPPGTPYSALIAYDSAKTGPVNFPPSPRRIRSPAIIS